VLALSQDGLVDSIQADGVEHLFYCQVDNPAVPMLDLKLVGQHVLSGADVTVLTVDKTDAAERAGTIVSINGRLHVLEYSLISESIANASNADGGLKFRAANTGIHLFRTDFLLRESRDASALPFHPAHKEVAHIDERGQMVEPDAPNAIKFERFVFDIFPRAETTLLIPVDREQNFMPVKDARSSETSPEAVQKKLCGLHRNWLVQAGVDVSPDATVEISPLVACNADELTERIAATGWQWRPEEDGPEVYLDRAA
jgi:UDP-N-acetylglucosamine/UDP-N-acetylgalactosamine diphosphorylase